MASSPTAKKTKNDTPGCMGGFLSFFDFHRHRHGRKLLTHKKYRDGTEAPRNSLDVGLETPQCIETNVEDIPYAHEVKIPHQKNLGKNTTVKTLIAEEISKRSDSRRRSPNVVARLMGLEVMPEEYMTATHCKAAEIYPHNDGICNQPVEKHLHIPTGNHRKQQFPYELSRRRTDPKVQHEHTYNTYEENPHWPDIKQTKMQVSAWQTSTACDKSNQVQADHLKMHMVKKSMITSQEDNVEATCECSEHDSINGSAEGKKLQGSEEEFAHAIEVLHANKDLCIKVLQESKLLAADSRDKCSVVTKVENPDTYWTGSRMERTNNRKHLQRLKANKFHLDNQEHQGEAMSFRKRCKDKLFSLPTRIVVLKPGTVKCQNSMLIPSPNYSPRSQTGQNEDEKTRPNTEDFLAQVREKLQMSIGERRREEPVFFEQNCSEAISDDLTQMSSNSAGPGFSKNRFSLTRSANAKKQPKGEAVDRNSIDSLLHRNRELRKVTLERLSAKKQHEEDEKQKLNNRSDFKGSQSFSSNGRCKNCSNHFQGYREGIGKSESSNFYCDFHDSIWEDNYIRGHDRLARADNEISSKYGEHTKDDLLTVSAGSSIPASTTASPNNKNIKLHVNGIDPETIPFESNGAVHDEFTLTANLISRKRRPSSDTLDFSHHLQNDKYLEIHSDEAMTETRATDMSDSSKETSSKALCNESEDLQELEIDPMTSTCVEEEVSVSINNFTNSESEMMPPNCESPFIQKANHPAFENLNEESSSLGLQQNLHCYPNVSTSEWKICKQINDRNNEEPIQTSDLNFNDDNRTEGSEKESASLNDSEMPYSEIPDSNQNFEEFDKVESETNSLHCYPNVSTLEDEWKICKQINDRNNEEPIQTSNLNLNDDNRIVGLEKESASLNVSEMPYSEIPDSNQNFEEFEKVEIETGSLPTSSESEMESKHNERTNATSETGPTDVVVCPTAVGEEIDLALKLVKGIPCPKERLDDLLFISNILVSGGLATNDCAYFSKQHSAVQKMHASVYQRIEECYNESTLQKVVDGSEGSDGNSDDHLLFDCINETLLEILKPYCHPRPWISQNVSSIIYMPSGKKLLEKVWAKVCSSLYPEADIKNELNSLLENDLGNARWLEFQDENDEIGNVIAQFILDNLIEDLVRDLVGTVAFSQ